MRRLLISSMLVCAVFAREAEYIELGAGYANTSDNLGTTKKSITSFNDKKKEGNAVAYVDIFTTFEINENTEIFLNSHIVDNIVATRYSSDYGIFTLGLKAINDQEWENPYLLNTNRTKTDADEYGGFVTYTLPLNENIDVGVNYEYSNKSYKKDLLEKVLKRDGNRHIIEFQSHILENDIDVVHNISFEKYDADGKASSYKKYQMELGAGIPISKDIELELLSTVNKSDYETTNPVFNKKLEIKHYDIQGAITCKNLIPIENTYVSLKAAYEQDDANINFYDKDNMVVYLTMGYIF